MTPAERGSEVDILAATEWKHYGPAVDTLTHFKECTSGLGKISGIPVAPTAQVRRGVIQSIAKTFTQHLTKAFRSSDLTT